MTRNRQKVTQAYPDEISFAAVPDAIPLHTIQLLLESFNHLPEILYTEHGASRALEINCSARLTPDLPQTLDLLTSRLNLPLL